MSPFFFYQNFDSHYQYMGLSGGSVDKESTCNAGDLGWEDPLEKGMATHSTILALRVPMGEEAGRLKYMGSQSQTWLSD